MGVTRDWEDIRPVGLEGFKDREMLWLWCRLTVEGYKFNADFVGDEESRARHVIKHLHDSDHETVGTLREYRNECFSRQLAASEFSWIQPRNERLKHWIIEALSRYGQQLGVNAPPFNQSVLSYPDQVMLTFDLGDAPVGIKQWVMSQLRREWSSNIEIDPALDWIRKSDDEQCRWVVEAVLQSDIGSWVSLNLPSPVSSEDRFLIAVNALDRSGLPLQFKKLFLKDLKSKWDKKNKKAVARKVQCNLNVDPMIKEQIKELAKDKGVKMGEYVEFLVTEEIKRKEAQGALETSSSR
ncbi:hypothetical protein [Marinobacter subterrani]|uniref:Uncharacterized protein n=1 Tax=Marinobacter subterrani TaxID=1658765 RepID=A0A0J7JCZ6_9GAMM|nr:hypothetical protein [Marinobacter subterrani]KMQ76383.1 hypothetical protein Msub_12596 [Marinobacter subterrani]